VNAILKGWPASATAYASPLLLMTSGRGDALLCLTRCRPKPAEATIAGKLQAAGGSGAGAVEG
jgi:hypothetical protein